MWMWNLVDLVDLIGQLEEPRVLPELQPEQLYVSSQWAYASQKILLNCFAAIVEHMYDKIVQGPNFHTLSVCKR